MDRRRYRPARSWHGQRVIVWKGYDKPRLFFFFCSGYLDVANAEFKAEAEGGSEKSLSSFADGLGAYGGQTLDADGHSYGSVVAGEALANTVCSPRMSSWAGSPGLTVDSGTGLHLTTSQFSKRRHPRLRREHRWRFGVEPSQPGFGGNRLANQRACSR